MFCINDWLLFVLFFILVLKETFLILVYFESNVFNFVMIIFFNDKILIYRL